MSTEPTFRDFAGAIMGGDLDQAQALLGVLLGTDAAQSQIAARHFQTSIESDPSFIQKAMGMRQVVGSGTRAELSALLKDCFALDDAQAASATEVVWARFRSS